MDHQVTVWGLVVLSLLSALGGIGVMSVVLWAVKRMRKIARDRIMLI